MSTVGIFVTVTVCCQTVEQKLQLLPEFPHRQLPDQLLPLQPTDLPAFLQQTPSKVRRPSSRPPAYWTSDPEVQGSNPWGTGRWGSAALPSPWHRKKIRDGYRHVLRYTGGTRPTQYFNFLTLRLWALHGKNRLQKAFVPLKIRRVAELLDTGFLPVEGAQ